MASRFVLRKLARYLPVAAILLSGSDRSPKLAPTLAEEIASAPAASSFRTGETAAKDKSALDLARLAKFRRHERKLRTRFQLELSQPELIRAENKLRSALAQFPAASEEARTNIAEHVADLSEAGVAKREIAATLGAMFAMEESIPVKLSILNELYYIQDPSVLEQVIAGVAPNQPLDVRDEAISVLRDMGDYRAMPSLLPLLADPDDNIREEAQEAIDAIVARSISIAP